MLTTGEQKFSLQLINPSELPDQICLSLAYILPQPHHTYCKYLSVDETRRESLFACN